MPESLFNPPSLEVARQVGDTFPDDASVYWGTDQDVGMDFSSSSGLFRMFDGTGDRLTLDAGASILELGFPDAGSSSAPVFSLYHDNPSPRTVLDDLGSVVFYGNNDAGAKTPFARLRGEFGIGTDGDELGVGVISVMASGVETDLMRFFGNIAALPSISAIEFFDNFGSQVAGKGLLVQGNQPAFLFDNLTGPGGTHSPTPAGLFFQVGFSSPGNGFEFRDSSGAVSGRITTDGVGGVLVQPGATTAHRGFDTLSAGQMNLARNLATLVKCWADFELNDAENIIVGTTTGTRIGTATSQKLGFFNATPVVQPVGTTELIAAVKSLGLMAAGTTPLTVPGTATFNGLANFVGGNLQITNGINIVTGATTGTRIATATNQRLGFWAATPVVQQVLATGVGATVDNVISLLQTLGLCRQTA